MWKIMFYRKSVCYSITSSNSSMKMNVRLRDFSDNEQNKTIFLSGRAHLVTRASGCCEVENVKGAWYKLKFLCPVLAVNASIPSPPVALSKQSFSFLISKIAYVSSCQYFHFVFEEVTP